MRRKINTLIGTVVCLAITGCGSSESSTAASTSIEDRLAHGIQILQERRINSKNVVAAKSARDNLAEMQAATPETLKKTRVASAVLVWSPANADLDRSESYYLLVYWMEDRPSIDEVEFTFLESKTGIILPISDADSEYNLEAAEQNVLYWAESYWEKGTEISDRLDGLTDWENLKVRLVRDGEVVTDWYPVSFYKDDEWVTNIPNPDRADESESTN